MKDKLQFQIPIQIFCPHCGAKLPNPYVQECYSCHNEVIFDRDSFMKEWTKVSNDSQDILDKFKRDKKVERIIT